jgi:hypothetical protein
MVVPGKASAVSLLVALAIIILALVYTAFNRAHRATPSPPLHETRQR